MSTKLMTAAVFATTVITFIFYSLAARAESGMCQTARERHPSLISLFCRDSEPPPEMENPSLANDDDDEEEESDDRAASMPSEDDRTVAREDTTPGCTLTGLYPYAGNCALDEMDHQVEKVFPSHRR